MFNFNVPHLKDGIVRKANTYECQHAAVVRRPLAGVAVRRSGQMRAGRVLVSGSRLPAPARRKHRAKRGARPHRTLQAWSPRRTSARPPRTSASRSSASSGHSAVSNQAAGARSGGAARAGSTTRTRSAARRR
jgi:hypothetical protein